VLPLPRGGRERGLVWPSPPSPQGHPTSMACGCPTGPDRCEARLNSRFANVKSLRQSRRLKPRPGHPSACLTGPSGGVGAVVFRWGRWIYSGALRGGSPLRGIHPTGAACRAEAPALPGRSAAKYARIRYLLTSNRSNIAGDHLPRRPPVGMLDGGAGGVGAVVFDGEMDLFRGVARWIAPLGHPPYG
jgi:hypothetical protein